MKKKKKCLHKNLDYEYKFYPLEKFAQYPIYDVGGIAFYFRLFCQDCGKTFVEIDDGHRCGKYGRGKDVDFSGLEKALKNKSKLKELT